MSVVLKPKIQWRVSKHGAAWKGNLLLSLMTWVDPEDPLWKEDPVNCPWSPHSCGGMDISHPINKSNKIFKKKFVIKFLGQL